MGKRESVVQEHVLWSIGAGLVPLPIVDIVAVTAVQLDMLKKLSRLYGMDFSETEGKAWVAALAGNMAARIGANALKLIPGFGSILGGLTSAIVSGASTYALGQVAIGHFDRGGTLGNMDMEAARRAYAEAFEKGKEVASRMSREKKDVLDQIERLGGMKEKGLITEAEYEAKKRKLLEGI